MATSVNSFCSGTRMSFLNNESVFMECWESRLRHQSTHWFGKIQVTNAAGESTIGYPINGRGVYGRRSGECMIIQQLASHFLSTKMMYLRKNWDKKCMEYDNKP